MKDYLCRPGFKQGNGAGCLKRRINDVRVILREPFSPGLHSMLNITSARLEIEVKEKMKKERKKAVVSIQMSRTGVMEAK